MAADSLPGYLCAVVCEWAAAAAVAPIHPGNEDEREPFESVAVRNTAIDGIRRAAAGQTESMSAAVSVDTD